MLGKVVQLTKVIFKQEKNEKNRNIHKNLNCILNIFSIVHNGAREYVLQQLGRNKTNQVITNRKPVTMSNKF